ncbi:hypothetical protein ACRAR1_19550 [Streptomyces sanyensis]|uniref:hypothetical protein n=1 Tax=Streptomyces sanyensis TaxID=568869 RepID=UPI003D77EC03
MSRGLVHALAWSLSTGAAVTLSWWGVHSVMAGTAYDRPRALPITAQTATASPPGPPEATSTRRTPPPSPTPSPRMPGGPASPASPPPPASSAPAEPTPSPSPARQDASGDVRGYTVDGGRVVFDIGASAADLVSATPEAGWQMQVWTQPTWIRVTFTRDGREVSVFCTWHDHPPMVQFDER